MREKMMATIVTIGGGEIRQQVTLAIDRAVIRLTRKRRPRVLFVPTASSDSEDYWQNMQRYYGGVLQCTMDVLWLLRERPAPAIIRQKIFGADLIYVGGGNTLRMMRRWRQLGVDRLLRQAGRKGAILCGVSAGAICWYAAGHSDSRSFTNPHDWDYIKVRGMDLVPFLFCPHYDSHTLQLPRRAHFQRMIKKIGGLGIACDDGCAIIWRSEGTYQILTSLPNAGAYRVYRLRGRVVEERLEQCTTPQPIADLRRV